MWISSPTVTSLALRAHRGGRTIAADPIVGRTSGGTRRALPCPGDDPRRAGDRPAVVGGQDRHRRWPVSASTFTRPGVLSRSGTSSPCTASTSGALPPPRARRTQCRGDGRPPGRSSAPSRRSSQTQRSTRWVQPPQRLTPQRSDEGRAGGCRRGRCCEDPRWGALHRVSVAGHPSASGGRREASAGVSCTGYPSSDTPARGVVPNPDLPGSGRLAREAECSAGHSRPGISRARPAQRNSLPLRSRRRATSERG